MSIPEQIRADPCVIVTLIRSGEKRALKVSNSSTAVQISSNLPAQEKDSSVSSVCVSFGPVSLGKTISTSAPRIKMADQRLLERIGMTFFEKGVL